MSDELTIERGADGSWLLEIDDVDDAAVATFTGAEPLTCSVWAGDDQAALCTPTAAWATPPQFTLSVSAAQSAALLPGSYRIQLAIAVAGGLVRKRTFGPLVVRPSPGSAAARPVYCTRDELLREAGSWAERLLRADVDQAGFAEERADAREEFEEWVHLHYRGVGNGLGAAWGAYSPWTYRRGGFRDPWLVAQLAANNLMATRRVVQCVACLALAKVCQRQIDPGKEDGWAQAMRSYARRAESIAATLHVEIDTNGDGRGDVIIPLGTADSIRA